MLSFDFDVIQRSWVYLFQTGIFVAAVYFALCFGLSLLVKRLQNNVAIIR